MLSPLLSLPLHVNFLAVCSPTPLPAVAFSSPAPLYYQPIVLSLHIPTIISLSLHKNIYFACRRGILMAQLRLFLLHSQQTTPLLPHSFLLITQSFKSSLS